jgi:hypothetical protein
MSEERKPTRLPPPAFPPGIRRRPAGASDGTEPVDRPIRTGPPDEPFALADPAPGDEGEDIELISHDEPIPARSRGSALEQGVVTGIGEEAHLGPEALAADGDPYVHELVHAVSKLAEDVRRRGEAGLRVRGDMSGLESTLRAYCVGYLAGRRAEDGAIARM